MQKSKPDREHGSDGFFRFPSTPHLRWLGQTPPPRDDKLLSAQEQRALLAHEVIVEEKIDGANLGLSLNPAGGLKAQNRGQYLSEPFFGQFGRLSAWLGQHQEGLRHVLLPHLIIFGEWCAARHSLRYDALADWFLIFDVYDRSAEKFWSSARRDSLAASSGLAIVPQITRGHLSSVLLENLVMKTSSRFATSGSVEGIVIRQDAGEWCEKRAKLVHPNFTQAIETHWSKRALEWNILDYTSVDRGASSGVE